VSAADGRGRGLLSVVATPIGNVGDLTPRAREALGGADTVLCEDTRQTGKLLALLGISAKLERFDAHVERDGAARRRILDRVAAGEHLAVATDAGTPCVSDPGALLVRDAHAAGLRVEVLPGPSAVIAALSGSGLAGVPFAFWGFLPKAAGARREALDRVLQPAPGGGPMTHVFFVAGRDARELLAEVGQLTPGAACVLARELTKRHEGWLAGRASGVRQTLQAEQERGEAVLCVSVDAGAMAGRQEAAEAAEEALCVAIRRARDAGEHRKAASRRIAEALGVPAREVYAAWDRPAR